MPTPNSVTAEESTKQERRRRPRSEGTLLTLAIGGFAILGGAVGTGAALSGQMAGNPGAVSMVIAGPVSALVVGGLAAVATVPSYLAHKR